MSIAGEMSAIRDCYLRACAELETALNHAEHDGRLSANIAEHMEILEVTERALSLTCRTLGYIEKEKEAGE